MSSTTVKPGSFTRGRRTKSGGFITSQIRLDAGNKSMPRPPKTSQAALIAKVVLAGVALISFSHLLREAGVVLY